MKEKKPIPVLLPILFWVCAVMWSINVSRHFHYGTFDWASGRVRLDVFCAAVWIVIAIVWTIRCRRHK